MATVISLTWPGLMKSLTSRSQGIQTPLCVPARAPLMNTLAIQFVPEKCSLKPRPAWPSGTSTRVR